MPEVDQSTKITTVTVVYGRVSEIITALKELKEVLGKDQAVDYFSAIQIAIDVLKNNGYPNVKFADFDTPGKIDFYISVLDRVSKANDEIEEALKPKNDNDFLKESPQSRLDKMTIDELVEDYERALAENDLETKEKIEIVFEQRYGKETVDQFITRIRELKNVSEASAVFKEEGQRIKTEIEERLNITEDEKNNFAEKKSVSKDEFVKGKVEDQVDRIIDKTIQNQISEGIIEIRQAEEVRQVIRKEILRSFQEGDEPNLTEIGKDTSQKVELKKTEELIKSFRESHEAEIIDYRIIQSNQAIEDEMVKKGASPEQIKLVQKFNSEVIRQGHETGVAQMREEIQQVAGDKWIETENAITVAVMDPGKFEEINQIYQEIQRDVPGDKRPVGQNQYRVADDLFNEINKSPKTRELVTKAQDKIGFLKKIEEKKQQLAGKIGGKVIESKFGKWLSGKIGQEAASNIIGGVAKNIAEKGLARGLIDSLIGIANGSLKAGTMTQTSGIFGSLSKIPGIGKIFSPLAKLEGWWGGIKNSVFNWGKGVLKDAGVWAKGAIKSGFSKLISGIGSLVKGIGAAGAGAGGAGAAAGAGAAGTGVAAAGTPVWVIILIILLVLFLLSMIQSALTSSLVPSNEKTSECIPADKATEIINSGSYEYIEIMREGEKFICFNPKEGTPGIGGTFPPQEGLAGMIVQGECSVADKVVPINQCKGEWSGKSLPSGCTICQAGCGPSSVSMMTRKVNGGMTPDKIISWPGSAYSTMGCDGSSLSQASREISRYFPGSVTYDATTRSCDKQTIANWICNGKIVMVLANFYRNKSLNIGGHFVLAVAVSDGEIITADPYYPVTKPFDGKQEYGHVERILECLTVDAGAIK